MAITGVNKRVLKPKDLKALCTLISDSSTLAEEEPAPGYYSAEEIYNELSKQKKIPHGLATFRKKMNHFYKIGAVDRKKYRRKVKNSKRGAFFKVYFYKLKSISKLI